VDARHREAQWLASPGTSMGGQQMWSTMPPVSPGTHGNMWVMPPSPSATLKVNSPSATAPVPVWSQAPPTAGSSTTPGWPTLFSTCVRPRAKCSVCSACFFENRARHAAAYPCFTNRLMSASNADGVSFHRHHGQPLRQQQRPSGTAHLQGPSRKCGQSEERLKQVIDWGQRRQRSLHAISL